MTGGITVKNSTSQEATLHPVPSPSDVPQRTDCPAGCLPETSKGGTHGLSLPGQGSAVTAWTATFIPTLFGQLTTKVSLSRSHLE